MMREIRARGPIVGDIEPPLEFALYKQGVFSEDFQHKKKTRSTLESHGLNEKVLKDYNMQWQKVDHSITVIGWGEENGVKFWLCMNSYGTKWGEAGFFRVRRGRNDLALESAPSAYIPIVTKRRD